MNKKILSVVSIVFILLVSYITYERKLEKNEQQMSYYQEIIDEKDHLRRQENTLYYTRNYYEETLKKIVENKNNLNLLSLDESSSEMFRNTLFSTYSFSPRAAVEMLLDFEGIISYSIDSPVIKKDPTIEKDKIYYLFIKDNNKKITFMNEKSKTYKSLENIKVSYSINPETNQIIAIDEVTTNLRLNNYLYKPLPIRTTYEVMTPLPTKKVEIKLTKQFNNANDFFREDRRYVNYLMKEEMVEEIIVLDTENYLGSL